jgi:thiosulfate/3-mercaptopyruvate sulfurtransferase
MHAALNSEQILDARPKGRFDGTAPEPRAELSSGHMPGATNVPFSELKSSNGFLKTAFELEDVFAARRIDMSAPMITTCGSGITACAIALSLARVGVWDAAVYDGSWTEWSSTEGCPIEKVS